MAYEVGGNKMMGNSSRGLSGASSSRNPNTTTPQRTRAQGRVAQWLGGLLTPHDAGRLITCALPIAHSSGLMDHFAKTP